MLVINDSRFNERAEIIREKGTNRSAFFRGETDKYGWVDVGSSFLPSELNAAFLYAQLENLDGIQQQRKKIWEFYKQELEKADYSRAKYPVVPDYASNNAHMFYLVFDNLSDRTKIIERLKEKEILSVFHYLSLHKSRFYAHQHDGRALKNSDQYSDTLLRLPLFFELKEHQIVEMVGIIWDALKW